VTHPGPPRHLSQRKIPILALRRKLQRSRNQCPAQVAVVIGCRFFCGYGCCHGKRVATDIDTVNINIATDNIINILFLVFYKYYNRH